MGLFKKKSDPMSGRARALQRQIAELESQIKKLSEEPARAEAPTARAKPARPRLRPAIRPHGRTADSSPTARPEPVFEEVNQERLQSQPETATRDHYNELGMRKYDLAAAWEQLKRSFHGPATSNPKLVNYLAAGSVQGLRPLRYEKRVARNRFVVWVGFLILALWGLIWMFFIKQ